MSHWPLWRNPEDFYSDSSFASFQHPALVGALAVEVYVDANTADAQDFGTCLASEDGFDWCHHGDCSRLRVTKIHRVYRYWYYILIYIYIERERDCVVYLDCFLQCWSTGHALQAWLGHGLTTEKTQVEATCLTVVNVEYCWNWHWCMILSMSINSILSQGCPSQSNNGSALGCPGKKHVPLLIIEGGPLLSLLETG